MVVEFTLRYLRGIIIIADRIARFRLKKQKFYDFIEVIKQDIDCREHYNAIS